MRLSYIVIYIYTYFFVDNRDIMGYFLMEYKWDLLVYYSNGTLNCINF
jgi:hypothetical protein